MSTTKSPVRQASCTSSIDSMSSTSSTSSYERPTSPKALSRITTAPLPGVARQPAGVLQYCRTNSGQGRPTSGRKFSFTCSSSDHAMTEHYWDLPSHLPHQEHPCPPCQIETFRLQGDVEVTAQAKKEYPHLTGEMLVQNGRPRDDWQTKLTLEKYVEEKKTEERQMWHHVIRKWTQDLKKLRVLVSEEDGLSLLA